MPTRGSKGKAGLGIAVAYLSRIGVGVAIPLTDTRRYDLIIVHDDGNERVQVKTTTMQDHGSYVVHLRTVGGNKGQVKTRPFDPTDYEWLFVVCGDATGLDDPDHGDHVTPVTHLNRTYERYRPED